MVLGFGAIVGNDNADGEAKAWQQRVWSMRHCHADRPTWEEMLAKFPDYETKADYEWLNYLRFESR